MNQVRLTNKKEVRLTSIEAIIIENLYLQDMRSMDLAIIVGLKGNLVEATIGL